MSDKWLGTEPLVQHLRAELAAANTRADEFKAQWDASHSAVHKWEDAYAVLSARLERVRALADEWDKPYGEFMGHPDDVAALRAALGEDA